MSLEVTASISQGLPHCLMDDGMPITPGMVDHREHPFLSLEVIVEVASNSRSVAIEVPSLASVV